MRTIKIVLLIGLALFFLYILMVLIREMKGVSSNSNTSTIYRRARTPVAGPNPNVRRVRYYN